MSIPTTPPQKTKFGVNTNSNFNTYDYQTPGRPDPNRLDDIYSSPCMLLPSDDWFKKDGSEKALLSQLPQTSVKVSPDK